LRAVLPIKDDAAATFAPFELGVEIDRIDVVGSAPGLVARANLPLAAVVQFANYTQ
jgi:hypothetical protein